MAEMEFRKPTYIAVRTSEDSLRSIWIFIVLPLALASLLGRLTVQAVVSVWASSLS